MASGTRASIRAPWVKPSTSDDLQGDVHGVDDAPPQGVLNVVVDVGDVVGQADHLPLQRGGLGAPWCGRGCRCAPPRSGSAPRRFSPAAPPPARTACSGQSPRASARSAARSPAWPKGVCPRSWPRAMASVRSSFRDRRPGDGAGDAGDLQGVGHAGAVVVPLRLKEHLGLVLQPPESLGVDDPVRCPAERGCGWDTPPPAAAAPWYFGRPGRPWGDRVCLPPAAGSALAESWASSLLRAAPAALFYLYIRFSFLISFKKEKIFVVFSRIVAMHKNPPRFFLRSGFFIQMSDVFSPRVYGSLV